MVRVLPEVFLEKLLDDYSLETILEMNDIENHVVLQLLITEGLIDLEDLYLDMGDTDDE
jgi:S-adenosylmethionine synthetase